MVELTKSFWFCFGAAVSFLTVVCIWVFLHWMESPNEMKTVIIWVICLLFLFMTFMIGLATGALIFV